MLVNILVTNMMPIFTQAAENISQTLFIIFYTMLKGASCYIRLIFSTYFLKAYITTDIICMINDIIILCDRSYNDQITNDANHFSLTNLF